MDGPREHYANWIKPVRERQIPWFHLYVESNEQTELTSKTESDSLMENRWQLVLGEVRGCRDWAKGKRTHRHGQEYDDCRGGGSCKVTKL